MNSCLPGFKAFRDEYPEIDFLETMGPLERIDGGKLFLEGLKNLGVNGLLCFDYNPDLNFCKKLGLHSIILSSHNATPNLPFAIHDNQAIGQMAAEHLLEQGLKHFAYFCPEDMVKDLGVNKTHQMYLQRLEGFQQRLAEEGYETHLPSEGILTGRAPLNSMHGMFFQDNIRCWINKVPHPVGIFSATQKDVLTLISALPKLGISCPQEVSVISAGEHNLIQTLFSKTVTNVELDGCRLGYRACKALLEMIQTKGYFPQIKIPPLGISQRNSTQIRNFQNPRLQKISEWIHLNPQVSVKDVEYKDIAGCSRRQAELLIKQECGISLAEFLTKIRISQAKTLLCDTSFPISEIAFRLGFTHQSHFGSCFKTLEKCTPKQYRDRFKHHT